MREVLPRGGEDDGVDAPEEREHALARLRAEEPDAAVEAELAGAGLERRALLAVSGHRERRVLHLREGGERGPDVLRRGQPAGERERRLPPYGVRPC